jgi:hypothetical protein
MSRKRRSLLGKKLLLEGKIKIIKLSLALRFILLEQNELPKKQKCNLKFDLKGEIVIKKQVKKLLCGIKPLRKSNCYSLNDKFQINRILLERALCRLLILILLLCIPRLPFASDTSSAWQIWQSLQQLL